MAHKGDRIEVGWREWVALPGLGLPAVKVKVDTGARTSCLHAFDIRPMTRNGQAWVGFKVHPLQRKALPEIRCQAPLVDYRLVSDSGGHREKRYVILTPMEIAGQVWPIEITLTNRETMMFRMLLGRTACAGKLIVDPIGSYRTGKKLAGAYRKNRKNKQGI